MSDDQQQEPQPVHGADSVAEVPTIAEALEELRSVASVARQLRLDVDPKLLDALRPLRRYEESPFSRLAASYERLDSVLGRDLAAFRHLSSIVGAARGHESAFARYAASSAAIGPIAAAARLGISPNIADLGAKHDTLSRLLADAGAFQAFERQGRLLQGLTTFSKVDGFTAGLRVNKDVLGLASMAHTIASLAEQQATWRRFASLMRELTPPPFSHLSEPSRSHSLLLRELERLSPLSVERLAGSAERLLESAPKREEGEPSAKQIVLAAGRDLKHLVAVLLRNPEERFNLDPRAFEELVAHHLEHMGFQVVLTPQSRDGGRDVIAEKEDFLGRRKVSVECKRYAADNKVGRPIVERIVGVAMGTDRGTGLVVTTSTYSSEAQEYAARNPNLVTLRDGDDFLKRLASIRA